MKTTWKIAKAELKGLFSSPIAWLILIIFAFQAGLTFADLISDQLRYVALYGRGYNITSSLLTRHGGVFFDMQNNLFLYIPLLTMGLMSKEYSSGSIKLLYSSPITNTQIILGKYMAMLVYACVLTFILLLILFFSGVAVNHFDYAYAFTGLLGIFLLICAYAAIGLFMSAITAYQVVAAVGTLTVLAILNYMQRIGQDYDFIRDITYWLAISGRSQKFLDGMICSEDLLYFFIVIILFIMLSILKLKFDRTTVRLGSKVCQYGGVVVVALFLGYLTARPTLMAYYDATATKMNTLTPPSQEVVEKLDGGLTITTYVNLLDENCSTGLPSSRKWDMLSFEQYIRFKPETEMKYVYYYHHTYNPSLYANYPNMTDEEIAKRICEAQDLDFDMFMSPEEIEKVIDLESEDWHFVRIIERENGQTARLRIYSDNQRYPKEAEITAALKQMVVKSPKVAFLTGHGERDIYKNGDREFGAFAINLSFRHALVNQGFTPVTFNIGEGDIPADIDIVVLADPRNAYTEEEIARFNRFLDKGGNAIILGDAGHEDIMNPLTAKLGIVFQPGVLVQPSANYAANMLILDPTATAQKMNKQYYRNHHWDYKYIFQGASAMALPQESPFELATLFATPAKGAWNELQTTDFIDDKPTLDPLTEREDSLPVVVRLTRSVGDKEQRIVVFSDADCIANAELTSSRLDLRSANFSLITESFRDLAYDEFPVNDDRPRPIDDSLRYGQGMHLCTQILFMGLLPGGLLVWYLLLWWRRRSK